MRNAVPHQAGDKFDLIILGGGMIGLTLALTCAENNLIVALIDKNKIELNHKKEKNPRVSFLNLKSKRILQELNVWEKINNESINSVEKMCVWDGVGAAEIDFTADEIDETEMGFIVDNRAVISVLMAAVLQHQKVTVFSEYFARNVVLTQAHACIEIASSLRSSQSEELRSSQSLTSSLIVAADGAHSWLREKMCVEMKEKTYHQTAITAVIETEKQHQNTAYQVFAKDGPLALLPLKNAHQASMVWSVETNRAMELLKMDSGEFSCEIQNEFGNKLGNLNRISTTQSFPLVMRHAKYYVQDRMALIGDAAHTIHPLAGQGANLGLMDAVVLAEVLIQAKNKKQDIGSFKNLRKYERARKGDNTQMAQSMRLFKELFGTDQAFLVQLRNIGFNAVNQMPLLKRLFVQYAVGFRHHAK